MFRSFSMRASAGFPSLWRRSAPRDGRWRKTRWPLSSSVSCRAGVGRRMRELSTFVAWFDSWQRQPCGGANLD